MPHSPHCLTGPHVALVCMHTIVLKQGDNCRMVCAMNDDHSRSVQGASTSAVYAWGLSKLPINPITYQIKPFPTYICMTVNMLMGVVCFLQVRVASRNSTSQAATVVSSATVPQGLQHEHQAPNSLSHEPSCSLCRSCSSNTVHLSSVLSQKADTNHPATN